MKYILYLLIFAALFGSCQDKFLELKPNQSVTTPTSLKDFDALLDNFSTMNETSTLVLAELGTDDYYLSDASWNNLSNPFERNGYTWEPNIYEGQQCRSWNYAYHTILYTNIVLDGLDKIQRDTKNALQYDRIKGTALFNRAWQFFQLAQIFCDDYEKESADSKLGIPLKLSSDINSKIERSTISGTYHRIVNDLQEASGLLPNEAVSITRPSKAANYALLARVYLQMKEYGLAIDASNRYLSESDNLTDYNTLNRSNGYSFPIIINESFSEQPLFNAMLPTRTFENFEVDTLLVDMYEAGDLRREFFFKEENGSILFVGSYNGYDTFNPFPATDEVYLIKAECLARLSKDVESLDVLNSLLEKRYEFGKYVTKTIDNTSDALLEIINERRKELLFRGVRWSDIRRFRTDDRFATTLERKIGNKIFTLSPDQEKLYTWPIPDNVIVLSKMPQNPR